MTMLLKKITLKKDAVIELPSSKSISNRLLIIQALSNSNVELTNVSKAKDTVELLKCLSSQERIIHAGEGGTTVRFLVAYFFIANHEKIIHCDETLNSRPHESLFKHLEQLGAIFEFQGSQYKFPVKVCRRKLPEIECTHLQIDVKKSSQFLSAVLLIAPLFTKPFEFTWEGNSVSYPYITMTCKLMSQYGAKLEIFKNKIVVKPSPYSLEATFVESDWSSAAFFYCLASLVEHEVHWKFPYLVMSDLQADQKISKIASLFGVETLVHIDFIQLTKKNTKSFERLCVDFLDCPDLFPAIAVCCAMKKMILECKNVQHLRHKESDRLFELTEFVKKYGATIKWHELDDTIEICIDNRSIKLPDSIEVEVKNDHRLAMAYSLLSLVAKVKIDQPTVVEKSFPDYWRQLDLLSRK
ncbi:MAG: hypothetical protein IPH96_14610 [Saprospiraceae bacterium]|nr:hypothetical protein [Saprospiraceae bacterium]